MSLLNRSMGMPSGTYDPWLGQQNLFDPDELPLDAQIGEFMHRFRDSPKPARQELRRSLDLDSAYTLLTFARRAAVFAMRQGSGKVVAGGLAACAAIENEQVDDRDILMALAMLRHAASRNKVTPEAALGEAASLASPSVGELIEGFLARPAVEQDLRHAWGRVEVEAPGGVGLLRWGFRPWMPTLDITRAGVRIASAISAGDYQADDPVLAVELPDIWLSEAADPALGPILGSARAALLVQGRLRPASSARHASQQLSIWVVEASDASSAAQLRSMSDHPRPGTATIGVSDTALFTLAIGRSFVKGVPAFETGSSLVRFETMLAEALAAAS